MREECRLNHHSSLIVHHASLITPASLWLAVFWFHFGRRPAAEIGTFEW
jgi:hypothetical protein